MKQYKFAFLSEMGFMGTVPRNNPNMRTEFSWMAALGAEHYNITLYNTVSGYDFVFVIIPKGRLNISAEGLKIANNANPTSDVLRSDFIAKLKKHNGKVYVIQEGPHWWWTEYEIVDQINYYNVLAESDGIFAHNESDTVYYKGLFPSKKVEVIKSLMIGDVIPPKQNKVDEKVIIGGNFARWYGGFESYIIASTFGLPIWVQDSHCKRENEEHIDNLNHLERLVWSDWMSTLSTFKYAVHLMPTVAAGTFALNCAYYGVPCIGNEKVDTQRLLFPDLKVDVSDIKHARDLANELKCNDNFYKLCSEKAINLYNERYTEQVWLDEMKNKI